MRKNVTIREHDYGYKVTARGEGYGHEQNWHDLGDALQDAHDYLKGEEDMNCKSKDCNNVKVGDEVKVVDGSWAKKLVDGRFEEIHGIEMERRVWRVVATDLVLSGHHGFQKKWSPNDTIIHDGCRTVFIRHQFLEVENASYVKCESCGARIRLS